MMKSEAFSDSKSPIASCHDVIHGKNPHVKDMEIKISVLSNTLWFNGQLPSLQSCSGRFAGPWKINSLVVLVLRVEFVFSNFLLNPLDSAGSGCYAFLEKNHFGVRMLDPKHCILTLTKQDCVSVTTCVFIPLFWGILLELMI